MGMGDKISHAAEDLKGKAKEHLGKATDNKSMEVEGLADQAKAKAKETAENIKDNLQSDD